jgi:hypothetical protein
MTSKREWDRRRRDKEAWVAAQMRERRGDPKIQQLRVTAAPAGAVFPIVRWTQRQP